MEFAVKRFARNILLLHLLLLLVVLAMVLLASRAIRNGAQVQAQHQAEIRQRMLASQTARGIQAFYQSILDDMNLIPNPEDSESERARLGSLSREFSREFMFPLAPATQPAARPAFQPPRQGATAGAPKLNGPQPNKPRQGRGLVVGQLLGRQLGDRVTALFAVSRRNEPPPKSSTRPTGAPKTPHIELALQEVSVQGEGPDPKALLVRYHEWLLGVKEQSISRFEVFDGRGYNLVAMPVGDGKLLLVAAVPVSAITEQFLSVLNSDPTTNVMLVNDSLTVMAASRASLVGDSIQEQGDTDLQANLELFRTEGFKSAHIIDHSFRLGCETFEPSLISAESIDLGAVKSVGGAPLQRKWFLVVSSPLREVDAVVGQVFGRLVIWAVVVVVAITAVLVSTAIQMIRGRLRLERVQAGAMRAELDRARQIQQAWLPRAAPACSAIDIAAVNFPAHHISGDFYNWFDLPDGRIAVVIGDVTGHGMSAAFLMATTQLLVRTTMQRFTDPAACLEEVNRQLCTLVFNGQFVTLQLMVLDPAGGPVEVCSAGHPAPLVAAAQGGKGRTTVFKPLPVESGLVLGVDPAAKYETTTIKAPPGAALLLYTDGAIDAQAPSGKRLGNEGLLHACPERLNPTAKCGDAQAMLDGVVNVINHFRGSRELGDDLTFVAIRLTQTEPALERELVGAV
jgi:serine phosphatase RsbU (regulator of sigma subunit)